MKREHRVAILCLIVIGCLIAVGFAMYYFLGKIQRDNYIQSNSTSFSQGETVLLDSAKDEEGRQYGFVAGFDWNGTMEVTVEDSIVYSSVNEFGISETELLDAQHEDSVFLVCKLKMKNNNAVLDSSYTKPSSIIKGFDIDVFSLQVAGESRKVAYFNGGKDGAEGHYRTLYDLSQDEEREFLVGYFISPKDLEQDIYYKVGISSTSVKYRILLNPISHSQLLDASEISK